jgi:glyoxylase-like metal-dependent hydrolase (beta-lactamase superfamily II)
MQHHETPHYGTAVPLAPGLRRILAPNPSPMTLNGTNTYLLGTRDIAVIDPGPDHAGHLDAILSALAPGEAVSHIIVTHSHLDHAPLARPLAKITGAPVLAFGDARAGRSEVMQRLAAAGFEGGGEGIDLAFLPDRCLADGEIIAGAGWRLEVLHTPGHLGNHICLAWGETCFTADHVMAWASSLVSPPDGDLTDFMLSCARLRQSNWRRFYPGHGPVVDDPAGRLDWLIAHRRDRERAILSVLSQGPSDAARIAARVYTDTPHHLMPAAERNVVAHLIDLHEKSMVVPHGPLAATSIFARTDDPAR